MYIIRTYIQLTRWSERLCYAAWKTSCQHTAKRRVMASQQVLHVYMLSPCQNRRNRRMVVSMPIAAGMARQADSRRKSGKMYEYTYIRQNRLESPYMSIYAYLYIYCRLARIGGIVVWLWQGKRPALRQTLIPPKNWGVDSSKNVIRCNQVGQHNASP